jgi:DASS family divalent anion:Na+ symporter
MLSVIPYICYRVSAPEIKQINNIDIATNGLNEIGPMNVKEKGLVVVFITALMGWIFSHHLGLNESSVAIIAMGGALLFNIISWGDVLQNKGAGIRLSGMAASLALARRSAKRAFSIGWLRSCLNIWTSSVPVI